MARHPVRDPIVPDPRLVRALHRIVLAGAVLVAALPAARGAHPWIGALWLWLLAMPLASLWALHGCRLPRWRAPAPAVAASRLRRRAPQARRRVPARAAARAAYAA
ncbi:hypothetical protein [Cognatiluteimonas weifangensis]|uniref:Transmembrane protein n=1 Tax=Cognatiluteimonas weifangensis TaxID=2303539 RepID=A0A372DPS9_9GAMM|nr:hypothetical protein [Luteimonas weifangensis]RFP61590.1 hypothetical protein D0Y53_04580 [Luteimonas weifangensis]